MNRQDNIDTILRNNNVPQGLRERLKEWKDLDPIEELINLSRTAVGNSIIQRLRTDFEGSNINSTDFNILLNRLDIIGHSVITWDNNGDERVIIGGGRTRKKSKTYKKRKSRKSKKTKKRRR